MSWVQDSSLALQVLTNIETYLVEEEIRMVKLDKNCKYTRKNYLQEIYIKLLVLSIRKYFCWIRRYKTRVTDLDPDKDFLVRRHFWGFEKISCQIDEKKF